MIYNLNLGIGWASSGVEYAQIYRAKIFRSLKVPAKFIFMDMFPKDNIQHMTENIGFLDEEVEWLYTFFTDCRISPVTFTLKQLEQTFPTENFRFSRDGMKAKYDFPDCDVYHTVYLTDETGNRVHRVEIVANGKLIRKDYYTYCRIYSEYYAPLEHKAHLYQRRFYREDGTVCYEEIIDGDRVMYRFPDRILYSKEELIGYMISRLKLTKEDVVIIDRSKTIASAVLRLAQPAKVGNVIHAEHFNETMTNEDTILWNNHYEYPFSQSERIDFFVTATEEQKKLLAEQMIKYKNRKPKIAAIPVGSLAELKYPDNGRKPHSLITASRLAAEKHVDWIIDAVIQARAAIGDLTLDIFGKGAYEEELKKQIAEKNASEYIHLCGQQDLTEVYKNYEAYISGSMSEGFGLTLMEAAGSGLPIIGFDVRYGNQAFIDNEENGYLLKVQTDDGPREKTECLCRAIVKLFTEAPLERFHEHAYEKAGQYLTTEVEKKWEKLLQELREC